jgi:Icc-related predicted phosphoesterase
MILHTNAALSRRQQERLVSLVIGGLTITAAAALVGCSRQSAVARAFVEREQPDLVLWGHIHESRGEDEIGRTRVVNPGPAAAGHYAVVDEVVTVRLDP